MCPGITKLSARVGVVMTYECQFLRTLMTQLFNATWERKKMEIRHVAPPSEQSRCQVAELTFHFSVAVQTASRSVMCVMLRVTERERPGWDASVKKMWFDLRLKPPLKVFWIWENMFFFFFCCSDFPRWTWVGKLNKAFQYHLLLVWWYF